MAGVFSKVGGYKPSKNAFSLRHSNLCDMGFGDVVPIDCIEMVPGDVFRNDVNIVGRLSNSLSSPMLADMDVIVEAFFVPTRLLMGHDANFDTPVGERNFEELLVGGKDGNEDLSVPVYGLPNKELKFGFGGISDYIGIQQNVVINSADVPLVFPWRAYRFIWNEFYRFEQLEEEIQVCQYLNAGNDADSTKISNADYDKLLKRGWRRDYFTSALPFQQFGTSPAFQLEGVLPVEFYYPDTSVNLNYHVDAPPTGNTWYPYSGTGTVNFPSYSKQGSVDYTVDPVSWTFNRKTSGEYNGSGTSNVHFTPRYPDFAVWQDVSGEYNGSPNFNYFSDGEVQGSCTPSASFSFTTYPKGRVDLRDAVTFDISDIRTNFQIQKWMERNARGGVRYTEYLQSHFGVSPSDARLQRPEFVGSFRLNWIVSEVLQTSATQDGSTAQGNQAGQAICIGSGSLGTYKAYEFGYYMIMASVIPKAQYQQGLPRWLSRRTRFDFYSPEFAHLSEQAVLNKELFVSGNTETDNDIFGFQGIWNELRYLPSRVSYHMRSDAPDYSFDYWHQARFFSSTPVLNKEFLEIGSTDSGKAELMRPFAVQDENPFIMHFGFNLRANRPIPYLAEPGLVDHF